MTQRSRPWLPYLLLISALLLLALHEAGVLGPLEDVLSLVVAPVERGMASFGDTVGGLFKTVQDVRELQQQVEEFQRVNDALRVENIRLQEQYVAENQQLRELLNFQTDNPTYDLVGADIVDRGCDIYPCGEVVGQDTNPYLRYLIINVGSRDGVAVGMPVVSSGVTLVGRIARVAPNLSYVQLINDPGSQVAVLLQRSRVSGIVEGREDGALIMTEILPDETVEENEIVITSGLGGLLPKGLVLGQVESVRYLESELFQEAVLRPALDFRRMEVVVVITEFGQSPVEEFVEETE